MEIAIPCGTQDGEDCEALHLMAVTDSTIKGNTVENNLDGGIYLTDEIGPTSGNTISDNQVLNNQVDCGITRVFWEIQKQRPDMERVRRTMLGYMRLTAWQGLCQLGIIFVMVHFVV
jgi:parallel beta-helix repeat protein